MGQQASTAGVDVDALATMVGGWRLQSAVVAALRVDSLRIADGSVVGETSGRVADALHGCAEPAERALWSIAVRVGTFADLAEQAGRDAGEQDAAAALALVALPAR